MDEKVEAIRSYILKGVPERGVQYQCAGGLHKFRIEGDGPTHWLYFSEEVVDDSEPVILINLMEVYHIADTLNQAGSSKWLFLGTNGIRDVDDNFAE